MTQRQHTTANSSRKIGRGLENDLAMFTGVTLIQSIDEKLRVEWSSTIIFFLSTEPTVNSHNL